MQAYYTLYTLSPILTLLGLVSALTAFFSLIAVGSLLFKAHKTAGNARSSARSILIKRPTSHTVQEGSDSDAAAVAPRCVTVNPIAAAVRTPRDGAGTGPGVGRLDDVGISMAHVMQGVPDLSASEAAPPMPARGALVRGTVDWQGDR